MLVFADKLILLVQTILQSESPRLSECIAWLRFDLFNTDQTGQISYRELLNRRGWIRRAFFLMDPLPKQTWDSKADMT